MSQLCNKLHPRLTPAHLDQLMVGLITLEGSENMTQDQLTEDVYHCYMHQPRRIQLPDHAKPQ